MRRLLVIVFFVAQAAHAQTDSLTARVSMTSDPPGARIVFDSVYVGTAPVAGLIVRAGAHMVRCTGADELAWPPAVGIETLLVRPGDSVECHCVVPRLYHLVTDPSGAEIVDGDSVVATTPCFLTGRFRGKPLTARAAGYNDGLLVLPEESGVVTLRLQPAGSEPPLGPLITESQQRSLVPVYVSSGAAILSGAAAAYFKIKADSYYNDYRQTGDPALLDKIHRFDTVSGVALVISQVSIGALTYFLISR